MRHVLICCVCRMCRTVIVGCLCTKRCRATGMNRTIPQTGCSRSQDSQQGLPTCTAAQTARMSGTRKVTKGTCWDRALGIVAKKRFKPPSARRTNSRSLLCDCPQHVVPVGHGSPQAMPLSRSFLPNLRGSQGLTEGFTNAFVVCMWVDDCLMHTPSK